MKFILLCLLFAVTPRISLSATTATNLYHQLASQQKIKLQQATTTAKIKVNNTKPLPNLNRPSIRATTFHLQQYKKAQQAQVKSDNQSRQN